MSNDDTVSATFYLQLSPQYHDWVKTDGMRRVIGAKAERITAKPPQAPVPGTVTVKLTVRVPKVLLQPLVPEAVVVIPAELVTTNPIEVIAENPEET